MNTATHTVHVETLHPGHKAVRWTENADPDVYVQPSLPTVEATVYATYDGADDAVHAKTVHVQLDIDDDEHVRINLNDSDLYVGTVGSDESDRELLRQAAAAYFSGEWRTLNTILRGVQA